MFSLSLSLSFSVFSFLSIYIVVVCVRVMDAGSLNSSSSSSYLNAQSRWPLRDQFHQKKSSKENVISCAFYSFAHLIPIVYFSVPSCN